MLAKRKLNSTETLMSQTLLDMDINHEEFKTIVIALKKDDGKDEKEKYEQMKESFGIQNVRMN